MNTIQGIEIENNSSGKPQFVRINLDQYGDKLAPFLAELGILPAKDDFDLEWEKAVPLNQAREISINKIRNWWGK